MDKTIAYLFPIFITAFFVLLAIAVSVPRKRTAEETGLLPEFEEICGGRINLLNYTWPLVRHSIYKEFIVIKCLGGQYIVPRAGLNVENADGVLSSGVRYKSSKYLGYELRIRTTNKNKVLKSLGENA